MFCATIFKKFFFPSLLALLRTDSPPFQLPLRKLSANTPKRFCLIASSITPASDLLHKLNAQKVMPIPVFFAFFQKILPFNCHATTHFIDICEKMF